MDLGTGLLLLVSSGLNTELAHRPYIVTEVWKVVREQGDGWFGF